ncbi:peptide chain release factor N(5)-glutamine methyltransferase [Microbacterium luticocti]|uniref:peptide chain release factor N(5)-glutamine methyltransferase n=1 Tax=Microbacterium luticocti TaxID=451764 RepID=UPI00040A74A4|nr:peptide chain release factor N(5)-glutamine methyltransferase [Microbacterium luticocti]
MDAAALTSLRAALGAAASVLADAGVPDSAVDAELLLAHVLGTSRGGVQAAAIRGDALDAAQAARYDALVARRAGREPLQHLTGRAPFRHLELEVGPGVFVPRPETEVVAQLAIDALGAVASAHPRAIDLGTGSGAIALALATEVPHAEVWAIERSTDAAAWARRNIERHPAAGVHLVVGDLADPPAELIGTVDVVVSNPPYVPDDAIPRDPEVSLFDPPQALYSGPDGLDAVRVLGSVGMRLARPGGVIVIEHGEWQGEPIRDILAAAGWRDARTHRDLTGRDRATVATRP